MIKNIIDSLNENKFFVGCMMIIVTIGGRFIFTELSEPQKKLIHSPIVRRLFIFCAFFMATRDIQCAIVLTILFVLIISELFNGDDFFLEKSEPTTNEKDKRIDQIIDELNQMKNVY